MEVCKVGKEYDVWPCVYAWCVMWLCQILCCIMVVDVVEFVSEMEVEWKRDEVEILHVAV